MKLRNVNWKSAFLTSALLAASSVPAAAGSLYNQPYDNSGNLYGSQNDTNIGGYGNFATAYDDFTLGTTASITGVNWTGGYYNGGQAAIAQFTLVFWADNAGVPGGILASDVIPGTANETSIGGPIFAYSAAVTLFAAAAGTKYWLSIVPDIGYPPQWGWATGTGGDAKAYQCFEGTCGATGSDFAFGLSGTSTPEPVSFSLAGIGLGLVGLASWKRRKRTV
jgi:hypothetical protein